MNFLFRRSASIAAASASKRTLAALLSSEPLRLPPAIPSESFSASSIPARKFHGSTALEELGFGGLRRRDLHSSSVPLGFRATDAVRVEYAVDEFYDEEKSPAAKKGDEGLEIAKLGIAQEIVSNLAKKGITKLFPIQKAVLEPAMQGRDMTGRAKTGTGKTLAFGIPIMDKILRFNAKHGRGRNPLAIVLAPTRELARQVEKEFRETAPLDTVCIYGGSPIQQQMRTLDYGVDVVVGTPGRIIDLLKRGALNLSEVQFVVLDEADQMLAVGFDEDVEIILEKLPRKRQSMMFSATMPPWIRKLTQKYLNDPLIIDLVGENDQKLAEGITLYSIATDNYGKSSIIGPLIKEHAKGGKCIVFTQTKRDADRLSYAMSRSFGCQPLHGDISQNMRERTLAGFRDGHFNILVATDVAARGLDIPNVDLIVHYELPNSSELFVHRSGRTGRAGKKGCAILIYTREQTRLVRGIEQDIGCKFTELPTIAVDGGGEDMFGDMGNRFGSSGGRMSGPGFGRGGGGGGYGGSNYGRPRGYGGSGGAGGFGGRTGGYGESGLGRFGSSSGSGFGRSGDSGSGRSGGFGSFGDSGSGRSGGFGSFGDSGSGRSGSFGSFGDSGSGRFGSFGDSGSRRSNSFGGSRSSSSGSFGGSSSGGFGGASDKSNRDDGWPGRSFMSSS